MEFIAKWRQKLLIFLAGTPCFGFDLSELPCRFVLRKVRREIRSRMGSHRLIKLLQIGMAEIFMLDALSWLTYSDSYTAQIGNWSLSLRAAT